MGLCTAAKEPRRPAFPGPKCRLISDPHVIILTLTRSAPNMVSAVTAVVSGIGGLLVGLVAGTVGVFVFYRQRQRRARHTPLLNQMGSEGYTDPFLLHTPTSAHYQAVSTQLPHDMSSSSLSPSPSYIAMQRMQKEGSHYQVEPFTPPGDRRHSSYGGSELNGEPHHATTPTTASGSSGNIYVVHHDAGRAPVTVYHQEGSEVVELPPRYIPDSSESGSATNDLRRLSAVATDGRTAPYSANDLVSPSRKPNRPRKP